VVSFDEFAQEVRRFDNRRVVLKEVRRELREPLPSFRKAVKAWCLTNLPRRGGLAEWVATLRITMQVRDRGRTAGIRLRGSRASTKDKADLKRLDADGRVRHPLYGDRRHWFQQQVTPGFFSGPFEAVDWEERADRALDRALDQIRRG
jgi:hypothetical protein